jgi:hypothetical protein
MEKITVGKKADQIFVTSPYNKIFIERARYLGGKWKSPAWVFDARNEKMIREALLEVYGSDGEHKEELVTVELFFPEGYSSVVGEAITFFGRTIARAFGRDSGAKLGDGVVILSGGFTSGGSMKNWHTTAYMGTRILVRDVPKKLAEDFYDRKVEIKIIEEEKSDITKEELIDALKSNLEIALKGVDENTLWEMLKAEIENNPTREFSATTKKIYNAKIEKGKRSIEF